MENILILAGLILVAIISITSMVFIAKINARLTDLSTTIARQHNSLVKMQNILRSKSATNAVAENSEMIYQDLLQSLIPIMAAMDIMPRATTEHPLWRTLGGLMDAYSQNRFTLEKLRRSIKLDSEISRSVDNYMARADKFLQHLTATEPDGILATTFTNGLLGQSLTFFAQAKQLAAQSNE